MVIDGLKTMSFSASFALTLCPSCGEPIMPSGLQFGNEPEHMTATCPNCRRVIEMKRDPRTGEMKAKRVEPN